MLIRAILTKVCAYLGVSIPYFNSGDLLFSIKSFTFMLFDLLREVCFWFVVYIIVKDKRAVLIAGSLAQLLMLLLFVFLNFEDGIYTSTSFYQKQPYFFVVAFLLIRFIPFFVLGILNSNTIKASLFFYFLFLVIKYKGLYLMNILRY